MKSFKGYFMPLSSNENWDKKWNFPHNKKKENSLNQNQKEEKFGWLYAHMSCPHVTTNIWTKKKYLHCGNYVHRKKNFSTFFYVHFNSKHVIHTIFVPKKRWKLKKVSLGLWVTEIKMFSRMMLEKIMGDLENNNLTNSFEN